MDNTILYDTRFDPGKNITMHVIELKHWSGFSRKLLESLEEMFICYW